MTQIMMIEGRFLVGIPMKRWMDRQVLQEGNHLSGQAAFGNKTNNGDIVDVMWLPNSKSHKVSN